MTRKAGMYHYTECGLPSVWLVNGFKRHQTPYGEAMIIENVDDLHRAIGMYLVRWKAHLTGAEFRYLRKELGLSQSRLASTYFGNDAQSIALWEKRSRVPKWADRFLRAIYREHKEGNAQIQELVARLNDLDRHEHERQLFKETSAGWTAAA